MGNFGYDITYIRPPSPVQTVGVEVGRKEGGNFPWPENVCNVLTENLEYCRKQTTFLKDMFRHAYAIISLILEFLSVNSYKVYR